MCNTTKTSLYSIVLELEIDHIVMIMNKLAGYPFSVVCTSGTREPIIGIPYNYFTNCCKCLVRYQLLFA